MFNGYPIWKKNGAQINTINTQTVFLKRSRYPPNISPLRVSFFCAYYMVLGWYFWILYYSNLFEKETCLFIYFHLAEPSRGPGAPAALLPLTSVHSRVPWGQLDDFGAVHSVLQCIKIHSLWFLFWNSVELFKLQHRRERLSFSLYQKSENQSKRKSHRCLRAQQPCLSPPEMFRFHSKHSSNCGWTQSVTGCQPLLTDPTH